MARGDKSTADRHEAADGGTVSGIARGMGATADTVRQLAGARDGVTRLSRDQQAQVAGQLPVR